MNWYGFNDYVDPDGDCFPEVNYKGVNKGLTILHDGDDGLSFIELSSLIRQTYLD